MKDKSDNTWNDAVAILDQLRFNAAANRFYYAVFQAVYSHALDRAIISADDEVGLHGKARRIVRSTGHQSRKYTDVFDQLLDLRTRADYCPEDVEPEDLDADLLRDANSLRLYFSKVLK